MDIRAKLKEELSELGVKVSDDILDKCEEICFAHKIDAEALTEAWMAYSVSNNICDLTTESLTQMERKEFGQKSSKDSYSKEASKSLPKQSPLVIYNANRETSDEVDDDILNIYCSTPKGTKKRAELKKPPESYGTKPPISSNVGGSPLFGFSPASFSPKLITPSSRYISRTNAGECVGEWGEKPPNCSWKANGPLSSLQIATYPSDRKPLNAKTRYMYEKLRTKAIILNEMVDVLGEELIKKHDLEEPSSLIGVKSGTVVSAGRICCDANARLNHTSVLLEGSYSISCGRSVPVKLNVNSTYALFPGQIVAVEGSNPTGRLFLADKVYSDASLPLPTDPLRIPVSEGPLHIVVAAGPFTHLDNMTYQPLEDLLKYVQENQPHILILAGPFLDVNHPQIGDNDLAESFSKVFGDIIENIMRPLTGLHTQVVLVPSTKDVHHIPVYPTPPFELTKQYPNLHLMQDPCLLDLSGIIVAVTATDVLMHLGKEEICNPPQGTDRLGRLSSHILNQHNMYPLFPPPEELNIETNLWDDQTDLPVTPHILILPSDLRYFLKNVNGCMVVNPERLAKGSVGGTFARLQVKPEIGENGSIAQNIYGNIVRI